MRTVLFVVAGLALAGLGVACGPVEIRFENLSAQAFDSLQVDFGRAVEYGPLPSGEQTEYRRFDGAYDYGYVRVVAGAEAYVISPIDYVGEDPLEPGHYTHSLQIEGSAGAGVLTGTTRRDD